jgi:hypothetical protein
MIKLKNDILNNVNPFNKVHYYIINNQNDSLEDILNKHQEITKRVIKALKQLNPEISSKSITKFVLQLGNTSSIKTEEVSSNQTIFNLNEKLSPYKITPLITAILFGNKEAYKLLLEADVNPNESDFHNWTALHHAAAINNEELLSLLLDHKADPYLKTDLKGTVLDILWMVKTYFPTKLPITLYESNEHKPLTNMEFKKLTGAFYTGNIIITTDQLYKDCYLSYIRNDFDNTKLNKIILENECKKTEGFDLYIEKNKFGFGVKAQKEIPPFHIITEYTGTIIDNPSSAEDVDYLLCNLQGQHFRNIGAMVNDSLPNTIFLPISINGYTRSFLVSLEKIEPNTPIHISYGESSLKNTTHSDYNYSLIVEFLKKLSIKELFEQNKKISSQNNFKDYDAKDYPDFFVNHCKLQYLPETPLTLIRLILEDHITTEDLAYMEKMYSHHVFFKEFYPQIKDFLDRRSQLPTEYLQTLCEFLKPYFEKGSVQYVASFIRNLCREYFFNHIFNNKIFTKEPKYNLFKINQLLEYNFNIIKIQLKEYHIQNNLDVKNLGD